MDNIVKISGQIQKIDHAFDRQTVFQLFSELYNKYEKSLLDDFSKGKLQVKRLLNIIDGVIKNFSKELGLEDTEDTLKTLAFALKTLAS